MSEVIITPDWPVPANVHAAISTRMGGVSEGCYSSNNLALHVGDSAESVQANRQLLMQQAGLTRPPQWLEQVHGNKVVEAVDDKLVRTADGCFTRDKGLGCMVLTADCLPVFFANQAGTQVSVAHAGWRGLAQGVLVSSVASFVDRPQKIVAYLGPAIGPQHFEVGVEVLEQFFESARNPEHADAIAACFAPSRERPLHFLADLYGLARAELEALGVTAIYGGDFCTFSDSERFYSFRREGVTGRMASLIWLT